MKTRTGRLSMEYLESRYAPSATLLNREAMAALPQPEGVATANPEALAAAPAAAWAFSPEGRPLFNVKTRIQNDLIALFPDYQEPKQPKAVNPHLQFDDVGNVLVRVTGSDIDRLTPRLKAAGFIEVAGRPDLHFTEGFLPVGSLPQVERLDGLLGVVSAGGVMTNAGVVTSQGDWVMQSDRVRDDFFMTGSGKRVGVISDSYNYLGGAGMDVAQGDLPAGIQVIQDAASLPAPTDEGRAMLQIVHDVAPGAGLAFATGRFGEANFAANITKLADAAQGNCDIIVDDLVYFYEPMFQHGVIAQAITAARQGGKAYFSSSGNNGDQAYESTAINFAADGSLGFGTFFDFDPGVGVDHRQRLNVGPLSSVRIALQWDMPFYTANGVTNDVDLILYDNNGAALASSQDSNPTNQIPSEYVFFTNPSTTNSMAVDVVIKLFSGGSPGRIKWVNYGGNADIAEYATKSSSVTPHAAILDAEGVAATPYFDMTGSETFNARRGNVSLFSPNGATKYAAPNPENGPYLTAPDGANTSFFGAIDVEADGRLNFFGTSAAAPHAAAVAALVWQAKPALSPFQVYEQLENTADTRTATIGDRAVRGMVRAYDAVAPLLAVPRVQPLGVVDSFESGQLESYWDVSSTGAGRVRVTSLNNPAQGNNHVILDSQSGGFYQLSLNQLDLHINAAGSKNLTLSFAQKHFGSENPDSMPATFTNAAAGDGVAFSVDGINWYRIVNLLAGSTSLNTYQTFQYDLVAAAQNAGVTLSADTRIRFQQYDDDMATNAGMAFDSIRVVRDGGITGRILLDINSNGVDDGEPGLGNYTAFLDANSNGVLDKGNTFTFLSAGSSIPGNNTLVNFTNNVAGLFNTKIVDLDVTVNVTSPLTSALELYLVSPAGTKVQLFNNDGVQPTPPVGLDPYLDKSKNITATFDSDAITPVEKGYGPFAGRYRPTSSMDVFDGHTGLELNGNWTLQAIDTTSTGGSSIGLWNLNIATQKTYYSNQVANITDFNTTSTTIAVTDVNGPINDVDVQISLTHSYVGDLEIDLIAPNLTRVPLFARTGGGGDNFVATRFDDSAQTLIANGTAPFTGSFRPAVPLTNFNGLGFTEGNGNWRLEVRDRASGDIGSLNGWNISIGIGEQFSTSDSNGNYAFNNLTGNQNLIVVPTPGLRLSNVATIGAISLNATPGSNFGQPLPLATEFAGPNVTSIDLTGPNLFTNEATVQYDFTFSEPVYGVSKSNFRTFTYANGGGTMPGTSIASVTPLSPTQVRVIANTGTGSGYLFVQFVDSVGFSDRAYNPLNTSVAGQNYYIDHVPPAVNTITSTTPDGTYVTGQSVNVTLNFVENVTLTGGNLIVMLDTGATITVTPFTGYTANATYVIGAGDTSADLNVMSISLSPGATLRDDYMNDATFGLPVFNNLADSAELVINPGLAVVSTWQVNDGDVQRSRVMSLAVTFSVAPNLPPNAASAFTLIRQSDLAVVTLNAVAIGNTVTLTFNGGPLDPDSLADGLYTLTALASQITNLGANSSFTFHRLFGDNDGNATIDGSDLNLFGNSFGTNAVDSPFDFDDNGTIDGADLIAFGNRFGISL